MFLQQEMDYFDLERAKVSKLVQFFIELLAQRLTHSSLCISFLSLSSSLFDDLDLSQFLSMKSILDF